MCTCTNLWNPLSTQGKSEHKVAPVNSRQIKMYLFWQRGLQNGESFANTLHNFLCRFGMVKAPDHDLSDPGLLWGQTAQHVLQPIPLAAQLTQCRVKAAGLTQCRVKAVEYRFSCACVCVKYLVFPRKRVCAHVCAHVCARMCKWKAVVQFFLFKNSFSRAFILILHHTPSWKSEVKVVKYYQPVEDSHTPHIKRNFGVVIPQNHISVAHSCFYYNFIFSFSAVSV